MIEYQLDTNYVLRFLLKDVPEQLKIVREKFTLAKQGEIKIFVPYLVFIELDFTLTKIYQFPKVKVASELLSLAASPYLSAEKRDYLLKALPVYRVSNISLIDLLLFFEAQQSGKILLTFDKKLQSLKKKYK